MLCNIAANIAPKYNMLVTVITIIDVILLGLLSIAYDIFCFVVSKDSEIRRA